MALVSIRNAGVAFGGPALLKDVTLHVEAGERVCLVGRNGEGKSTLMRLLAGEFLPDSGEISRQQGLRIAMLPQQVPHGLSGTVFDLVAEGLGAQGERFREFHRLSHQLSLDENEGLLRRLQEIQQALDMDDGWEVHRKVDTVLSILGLNPDAECSSLSGGLKRRVVLARGLVSDPDLLMLDEPTNHLDIDSITWLENFLLSQGRTLLFVTHDRMFLQKLATRIVELDRGRLFNWACDYTTYLERKAAAHENEAAEWARQDRRLAEEEVWIRKGIKARRTRNEGRVRALKRLREERHARRNRKGNVRFQVQEAERSGRLVLEVEDVTFSHQARHVIEGLNTIILRGDKVGIIGPNGCGKTTLLQLLLGTLAPSRGRIRSGTRIEVAYFDQLREQLDEDKSVQENVADGNDRITVNGRTRHIIGYLADFLFTPDRARSPVRVLSGGERNRLLLARLFAKPSNLLVMDEPTNDLDAETLELLEELLMDYAGTLLLVSHDRAFLNNVVTSTLVFEGNGRVKEYAGGYDDWLRHARASLEPKPEKKTTKPRKEEKSRPGPRKLTFNERRELDSIPQKIEALETEQKALYEIMANPTLSQEDGERLQAAGARLQVIERELTEFFERWELLDTLNT